MKNGMKGLLIHDPYTTYYHVHFNSNNGSSIDSYPGLSHLYEHMALSCTKNYNESYHILRHFGGISGYSGGATSGYTYQEYFYTLPFTFLFDEGLSMITDSFINPLYPKDHIRKEIQAINAEFNINIDKEIHILDTILRTYSSEESPINLMGTGNNLTLNPNDSEILERKLKSYFNVFARPENFFFTLYSSLSIEDMEKYCEKYLNYEMNEFPEDEIDILEKNNLSKNIDKVKGLDFFKDDIFLHGFYYNSHSKKNKFSLSFYLTDVDMDEFKYDIFEFFSFLFQSESLLSLLKKKII
jgi:secreted Zn-dependent insulinase-like peptidase